MIDTIDTKVKGFLISPVATFQQSRDNENRTVLTYLAALLLFDSVITAVIAAITIPGGISTTALVFVMMLIGGIIFTLVGSAWLHLWVYLLGGRKGFMQTFKVVVYGNTPWFILGWIPFIGVVFMLWSLILGILGIRELHEIITVKAIVAVAVAVIIPLIIILIIGAYFISSYASTMGMPLPSGNTFPMPDY